MVSRTNLQDGTKEFLGTAEEMAALDTTGLAAFSTFWQTDTKTGHVWDGTTWHQV